MKIGVLVKGVVDIESGVFVEEDGSGIVDDGNKLVINPYDEYAVEEAIATRDSMGGEVVIVTAGPESAVAAMRQALAMGADRGIRADTSFLEMDSYLTAKVLGHICERETFDIIFAGKRALDDDCGWVHIGVAEILSIPHVNSVESLEFLSDGSTLHLKRSIAGGKKEIIESRLPMMIGCEKGLNLPRYASLPGVIKAKSKQIEVLSATDIVGDESPRVRTLGYSAPVERSGCHMIEGDVESVAKELIGLLKLERRS